MDFSELYLTYYSKLVRFAKEFVILEEDAENIVQDTFLYLWEHLELLEDIDHLDAFLFTLIKNRCLNFLKHQSYIQAISEVENLLSQTMQKLPERCREIFLLSRIEGLKYKEIAERLDISVNTVENQISIALRKLRSELKEYLPLLVFII